MEEADAQKLGVADKDRVTVEFGGIRGGSFHNVLVRTGKDFRLEFHIDTDEANAAGLKNGDAVTLRTGREAGGGQLEAGKPIVRPKEAETALVLAHKVIDAAAVKAAAKCGATTLTIQKGSIITPLARDIARECNIQLISVTC